MRVEYTPRAVADLRKISRDSRAFGESVAQAVEARIRSIVSRIGQPPESARRLTQRSSVRVVPVVRYPYKIFYTVTGGQDADPGYPAHLAAAVIGRAVIVAVLARSREAGRAAPVQMSKG
jgi:toxin ParE1/3/4